MFLMKSFLPTEFLNLFNEITLQILVLLKSVETFKFDILVSKPFINKLNFCKFLYNSQQFLLTTASKFSKAVIKNTNTITKVFIIPINLTNFFLKSSFQLRMVRIFDLLKWNFKKKIEFIYD